MKANLVVNPVAGNKAFKSISRIEALLREKVSLKTFITRKRGDAFAFAKELSNTDLIITAGGDGTFNEVINGILSSGNPEPNKIPLALIPVGTANVMAKELYIPENI